MNIKISPISVVNYGTNNIKTNKINTQAGASMQTPSFKSTRMIRNTMLALALLGTSAMVSCDGPKKNGEFERKRMESVIDQRRGIIPETFLLNNPETSILKDGSKVSKQGEYTITETPNSKIIRRDFTGKGGCEETTYYSNGEYSYEYTSMFPIDVEKEHYAAEIIYEHYNKDGEVLYWVNKTIDHVGFYKDGVVQYNLGDEHKGCKRIREYDEYGNLKSDYFKSKSGIITEASVLNDI